MQRTDIHDITFIVRCESGLHIGGSQDELKIGGSDNPVIKNPETREPYIPGSSLKGKMRAELERQLGRFGSNPNNPCGCAREDCPVCRMFGAHMNTRSELGPSRIIVRDGRLCKGGRIEDKSENIVRRQAGGAQHPRSNERVVEGSEFSMQIILQVLSKDEGFEYTPTARKIRGRTYRGDEALQSIVAECLYLVQMTGLGGGTSRGSGAVSFHDLKLDGEDWTLWSD